MSNIQPLTPENVVEAKQTLIPDKVIKAFNDMIAENWDGSLSVFKLKDVKSRIEGEIKKEWLDIEPIFRAAGWNVFFDRPGWDENYDSRFEFKKKNS